MSYRLGDIAPNPFRNVERYPIDRAKVEALKASISRSSFWDNIVARPIGDGAEIAYGHHRLVALRELFPPEHEVNLITRDLDDAAMLHIMADENMQEWTSSASVVVETVRAVRDFLAPTVPAGRNGQPLGAAVIEFLGWAEGPVWDALGIIGAEERGVLLPEDTKDLGIEQATVMRRAVRRITDPAVRREAVSQVRAGLTSGEIGKRGIPDVVNAVRHKAYGEKHERPIVPAAVAERLWREIDGYWRTALEINGQPITRTDLLRLIAEHRNAEELTRSVRPWADQIADALDEMASEAKRLADLLRSEQAVAIGA